MDNNEKTNQPKFSSFMGKALDFTKKTASEIQKNAKSISEQISEQSKKSKHDQRVKKYNPLFWETFKDSAYKIQNIIEIVDDAVRRGVDVCEGAMGWTDTHGDVEILHIYDEVMNDVGIQFIPFPKCDCVYCVDPFDRTKYIDVNAIFERTNSEKLAELENIAYCLGAKSCSIEIANATNDTVSSSVGASAKIKGITVGSDMSVSNSNKSAQSGKSVTYFEGNREPARPTLKWFAYDDNINNLIDMRCSDKNAIKSKVLEIKSSSSQTMSQKAACAIDGLLGLKGSASMEKQAIKENNSKLIFEIVFE